jgi:uncharacterized membrane protein YGL010W
LRTLTDHLAGYAEYHRDRRNIATHVVGVPTIVFAVMVLLSRPALFAIGDLAVTPALVAGLAAIAWYVSLDRPLGLLMAALFAIGLVVAAPLAGGPTASWLGWGAGLFVVGWIVQFAGHAWEGRKPAFVDDVTGLLVGPLFVVAEVLFALGLRRGLREVIESRAGPTRSGRAGDAAA